MFQKSHALRAEVKDAAHPPSYTSCYQARSASGGGTKSNPIQIILVCFICKHRNPIQNALKLLKGTISVTHWIIFLTQNNVTGLVFRLRVCKNSCADFRVCFVIASKYAHLVHISRVFHCFSKRACSPVRFIKQSGTESNRISPWQQGLSFLVRI